MQQPRTLIIYAPPEMLNGSYQRQPQQRKQWIRKVIKICLPLCLLLFTFHQIIQATAVDGISMEPNLHNGDQVLVNKWAYLFQPPKRGDVIIFTAPLAAGRLGQVFIKRVIAVPGDVISIVDGVPIVDGVMLKETYLDQLSMGQSLHDQPINNLIVPPNSYFVLGDNRVESFDSRAWGFVPQQNIQGKALLMYWPIHQDVTGWLPDVSSVFAAVHQHNVNPLQTRP